MKAKRLLSLILVLALFLQCVPAWAETVTVIEQVVELPFPTEPVPLVSLNMPNAVVVAYGERTGDALPGGVTFEEGMLTLDNVDLPGDIWADGDLTIIVRGDCKVNGSICVENGLLRIVGEENSRIEAMHLSANNGCLELNDAEVVISDNPNQTEEWDAIWIKGNITSTNSRILMPEMAGVFCEQGTLTMDNCVFDGLHLWVHDIAPIGGIHLTNCEITARSTGHTLFCYSGAMTVTDTIVHQGHIWAEEGATVVNSVFEDSRSQWYLAGGDVVVKNSEIYAKGANSGIFAHGQDIYIENSVLDLCETAANVVCPIRGINVSIRNSQVKVVSAEYGIMPEREMHIENSEITVESLQATDAPGIEIGTGGVSEIVNSKLNVKGYSNGISIIGGDMNVIASEIDAVGSWSGIMSGRGNLTVTGGKLNLDGGSYGIQLDNGTLELNGVEGVLKGNQGAAIVNGKGLDGDVVLLNGCDADAELVHSPGGMDNIAYFANQQNGDVVSEIALTSNGELCSVLRVSQSDCVMGSTASFVLSYFGKDAGDVRVLLPDGLSIVDGSVTVNSEIVSYSMDGSAVCVPGVLPGQIVRFSVTCAEAGDFDIAAEVAGNALDSVHVNVKDFSLGLPSATARTTLNVSGVAVPGSEITFYDGSKRIGRTESNLAGDWVAQLTISDTVGEHAISAKIKTPDGQKIEPQPETVIYDPETIEVLRLVMTNTIHGEKIDDLKTCETVFDFTTADVETPFYSYFPEYPTFTFSAELSANAAPEKVGRVFARTENYKGELTQVELTYNEFTGTWVGTHDYDEFSVPEVVSVSYTGNESGTIRIGDAYVSYTLDADGGMTIGEGEEAIRIVQHDNVIDITDMNGDGLRLLLVDENNMILSTTDGETLATVQVTEDSMVIESADKSMTMTISEEELTLSDMVSGCTLFASESGAEMSIPDGGGNITRYLSDAVSGEKIKYPDGTFEQWEYSEDGLIATYTARDGSTLVYAYDEEDNLTRVDGHLSIGYGESEIRYTDADGETLVEQDENGNIIRITYPDGLAVGYAYDENGKLVSVTDPMGNSTFYAYDEAGNIVSVSDDGGVVAEYAFDENGTLISRTLANGVRTEYVSDENAQTSTIRNLSADGSVLSEHVTVFDENGMAAAQSGSHGDWTFTYDEDGQLLSMTAADGSVTTYEYTPSGTIASRTDADGRVEYASNALNQITQMGDVSYQYDLNGQLVRETGPDGETVYEWDAFGRLVKVTMPDGAVYEYGYDAFGNRSSVTVNGEITRYIWNPGELPEIIGAVQPDGSYVRYIQGNGLEAQADANGVAYYQYDQLGSTVALTGADGQTLSSWTYNPIGEMTSAQETVTTPFGYVGQYGIMTDGNGLQYMRARYMHEDLSTFISPDPAWQTYDVNVYRYAGNNRVQFVDLTGEAKFIYWYKGTLIIDWDVLLPNIGWSLAIIGVAAVLWAIFAPTGIGAGLLILWVVGGLVGVWTAADAAEPEDKRPMLPDDPRHPPMPKPLPDDPDIPDYPDDVVPPYITPPKDPVPNMDPSGYVYEGATLARIEGVTATLYYKPTLETPDEKATVWNAEDYSQVNPLITDGEGKYAWMTNNGWFKVVYEKEGYETAESEWLPVPPIQTDVNIAMTSLTAPTVEEVIVSGDRVMIAFDKFMQQNTLKIELNGAVYEGEIIPVEQENGLVRRIALWRPDDQPSVNIAVSGAVSYAGVEMVPYAADVEVSNDVSGVTAENSIGYGSAETVRIRVTDSWNNPLTGADLTIANLTEDAVLLLSETVTTDDDGWAEVQIAGLKPGTAVLSVDGRASVTLQVRNENTSTGVYDEALVRDRQWRVDLHAEWTNGIDEPDELVEEYVGRFTAGSDAIAAAVQQPFMTELLAAWNQEVAELVKSRQNSFFTTGEILRLDEIIAERALYASALMAP